MGFFSRSATFPKEMLMEEHGSSAGTIFVINTKADLALGGGCVSLN